MLHGLAVQMAFRPNLADVANLLYILDMVVHLRQLFDRTVNQPFPFSEYPWIMAVETLATTPNRETFRNELKLIGANDEMNEISEIYRLLMLMLMQMRMLMLMVM